MSDIKTKGRNSSIELLKILAIIFIIIDHSVPYTGDGTSFSYINLNFATTDGQVLLMAFGRYLGYIGNTVFIICSSWFLLESKRIKKEKMTNLIADTWVLTVISIIFFVAIGCNIPTKVMLKSFFPITFNMNWFVTCYILFYLIHPYLNYVLEKMGQRELLISNLILIILYGCINILFYGSYFYTELIGFIVLYFIVAYTKRYLNHYASSVKWNVITLVLSTGCLVAIFLLTNYLGLRIGYFHQKILMWRYFVNPLIIMVALSIFNLFKMRVFYNGIVNYMASLSLLIYIIHENKMVRCYARVAYFEYIYKEFTYAHVLGWAFLLAGVTFVISLMFAVLYKESIGKVVRRITHACYNHVASRANKMIISLMRFN